MSAASSLKAYYALAKPGIVYGNALAAIGGFFLAAQESISWIVFLAMLVGSCFVIASACVFNNYLDRNIDSKMARTKKRALVNNHIPIPRALAYGAVLGAAGLGMLALGANALASFVALFGFVMYVIVYGIAKRRTVYGTLIGSISGAVPPIIGYAAASNRLDLGALILFIILAAWQMPHFYAIAIFRLNDYKSAGIPVLPAVQGLRRTKQEIVFYTVVFVCASLALWWFGYAGYAYAVIMVLLGAHWLLLGLQGFQTKDTEAWARKVFKFSLIILLAFCALLSLTAFLP